LFSFFLRKSKGNDCCLCFFVNNYLYCITEAEPDCSTVAQASDGTRFPLLLCFALDRSLCLSPFFLQMAAFLDGPPAFWYDVAEKW
jgi:hypothetical protein